MKCPKCGSDEVMTRYHGNTKDWQCLQCNTYFEADIASTIVGERDPDAIYSDDRILNPEDGVKVSREDYFRSMS